MAVTVTGDIIQMTATGENTSAVFGTGTRLRVNSFAVVSQASAGNVELRQVDASGVIIADFNAVANNTVYVNYSKPVDIENIYVVALPANAVVQVYLE